MVSTTTFRNSINLISQVGTPGFTEKYIKMFSTLYETWNSLDRKEKKLIKAGLQLILLLGAISIFILPLIFKIPAQFRLFDYSQSGPIGDTINGIAGPFIALLAAILTFMAFYIQYKANIEQKKQFADTLNEQRNERKEQEKIWSIERFENKFYELLKLHKANVEELYLSDKIRGRECFENFYHELRIIYKTCDFYFDKITKRVPNKEEFLIQEAYFIYFNGKHRIINSSNLEIKPFFEAITNALNGYLEIINPQRNSVGSSSAYNYQYKEFNSSDFKFNYLPFSGCINKLAHYYRHLFQTIKFVVEYDEKVIKYENKLEYLKTLRAQLSNMEQLMLYYNAIGIPIESWFKNEYFTKYRMIHNLPYGVADFGIQPKDHPTIQEGMFYWKSKKKELFEWDEKN